MALIATAEGLAQDRRRRILLIWIIVGTIAVGGGIGYAVIKPWRIEKLNRAARAAIERGDFTEASLKARRALQLDPASVPACLAMAEIAEHDRSPDAVVWRERVLQYGGESTEALLAYVFSALSFGKQATAKQALERVPAADRGRELYWAVAGAVAMNDGDLEKAARCYTAALELNPSNIAYRLACCRAQIASPDFFVRESGRKGLEALAADADYGLLAQRVLIASLESQEEIEAALRHAEKLAAAHGHTFADELLWLRLLHQTGADSFAPTLGAIEQKAASVADHAGALIVWMSRAGMARDALEWATKRAPAVRAKPEVAPAIAGCHLMLGDWMALLGATQTGPWARVEYVRHAYRARAFRETGDSSMSRTEWNLAISTAAQNSEALAWLSQMAREWQWPEETEQSLWSVLDTTPGAKWAVEALANLYMAGGNTAGLRRIASHHVRLDPADDDARNNFALSSLLLGVETDRGAAIARELHQKHPQNAAYASTYAYALFASQRNADALRIMESLPPERLEEPAFAAYYGIMLAASPMPEKARHYLEIGRSGRLLHEEKELVARAEELIAALPH